ncbi:MAG: RNA methyltransferase [Planctomycetes bacterium]|nr:RNA methyltransferase [Planctomycetota bacterium]
MQSSDPRKSVRIASPDDSRLSPYRDLKDKQLARAMGLFVVEGEHLVRRLLASDFSVHSVLMTEARFERGDWCVPDGVPVYLAPKAEISGIVGFPFHRGVLALGCRTPATTLAQSWPGLQDVTRLVICPEINDVENLGSLMRTGAALGYGHFLLGPSCCDPFARRAIRTSMGSVFQLNIVRSQHLQADLNQLGAQNGFEWHASVIDPDAPPLLSVSPPDRVGLLIGSEAHGLDEAWLGQADQKVTIPMSLGTDSLNVGVAAGIFMHHYQRPAQ